MFDPKSGPCDRVRSRSTAFCVVRLTALVSSMIMLTGLPTQGDDYIKVGAWNIENLGDRTLGQVPAAIAEHILLAGVDVLALEEIWDNDGDDAKTTNTKLDDVLRRINSSPGSIASIDNTGGEPTNNRRIS